MQNMSEETGSSGLNLASEDTVRNGSPGCDEKLGPIWKSPIISKSAAAVDLQAEDASKGDLLGDDIYGVEKSAISSRDSIVQLNENTSPSVPLKRIAATQRQWRAISQGYQNFFEFGELNCMHDSVFFTFEKQKYSHILLAAFMVLFLVVLSLEMNVDSSFQVNSVRRFFYFINFCDLRMTYADAQK